MCSNLSKLKFPRAPRTSFPLPLTAKAFGATAQVGMRPKSVAGASEPLYSGFCSRVVNTWLHVHISVHRLNIMFKSIL